MTRELTRAERDGIRALVTKLCANYCGHYKICLPLDCSCYMLGLWWTGGYCNYFQSAVLPTNPALEAALLGDGAAESKICPVCKQSFFPFGKRAYCSPACQREADRQKARERMRKKRCPGVA